MVPLIVSILAALGAGSVVGHWVAGGKDRRAARATALERLGAVEEARWVEKGRDEDHTRFRTAARQLEAAALIARVPRRAVILYLQYAEAALTSVHQEIEDRGGDPYRQVGISVGSDEVVAQAASVVSRAAWSSPTTRWVWLRWRLRRVRRKARFREPWFLSAVEDVQRRTK